MSFKKKTKPEIKQKIVINRSGTFS